MSVRSGQILHAMGNQFIIDRIQTAGVGTVNVPEELVYELGNTKTVATVRDIPDLSFALESFDVSTEIEAILTGVDPTTTTAHQAFSFDDAMTVDIISPFKTSLTNFAIIRGVATPNLTLENVTYRFGVAANATQSYTLRGDSIYYIPGTPYYQKFTLTSGTLQTYNLNNTAIAYSEQGKTVYGLSVCVRNPTTKIYKRLHITDDFTNTSSIITILGDPYADGYTELDVVYGSAVAATYNATVHEGQSVKPAAVRGKDIDVYLSDGAATPTLVRMRGVQSFEATRKVTLDADREFGSQFYVSQDYEVPDVSGNLVTKPQDAIALWNTIANISGTATNVVAGTALAVNLAMEVRISNPDTSAVLKTLYVPDAIFQPPGIQGRVQTKLQTTFPWKSQTGSMSVYKGTRT